MYSTLITLSISASRTMASRTHRNSCRLRRLVPALLAVQLLMAKSRKSDINAIINTITDLRRMVAQSFHCQNILEKTALDRGWTDRISLTHDLDLDLSMPCELWS